MTDSVEKKNKSGGTETKEKDGKNHHAGLTETHTHIHMLKKKNSKQQNYYVIVTYVLNSRSSSRRRGDGGEDRDSQSGHKKAKRNRKDKETNKMFSADRERKLKSD